MGTRLPNSLITPTPHCQPTSSKHRSESIRRSRSETPQPAGYPGHQKTLERKISHEHELYGSREGRHYQDSGTQSRGRSQPLLRENDPPIGHSGQHIHTLNSIAQDLRLYPTDHDQHGSSGYQHRAFTSARSKRITPVGQNRNPGQKDQSTQRINELMGINAKLESEVKILKEQLLQTKQECQFHIQEKSTLQSTVNMQNKTIEELRDKLERRDQRLERSKNRLRNKDSEIQRLSRDVDTTQRKVDGVQTELKSTKEQLRRSKHLLNQRTDELNMVDSYISRTNAYSDMELKKMVEMLNQEISQTSSTIVDSFDFGARMADTIQRPQEDLLECLGNSLPPKFFGCLSNRHPISNDVTEDLVVSLAIQAVIAKCAFDFAWSWSPSNSELSNHLEDIYQGLCSTDPLTSPRWRAMTRGQIRRVMSVEEVDFCYSHVVSRLELLLEICGWTPDYIKQNQRHAEAIKHGLSVITTKALDLNKALLEGTIRGGAKPIWFEGGSSFNPMHVDDSFSRLVIRRSSKDAQSQLPAGKILCTTDLGLQITTTRSEKSITTTILKAKVILEDIIFGNAGDGNSNARDAHARKR